MKKSYLVMAAAAALFAACSSNDLVDEKKSPQTTQPTAEQAVGFDAYVNRGTTRGGYEGSLTASTIQNASAGFGVFGYYTNNVLYGQTAIPDFFYNQQVTYSDGWTYNPIKYWPNEFGTGAESTGQDKLTFFAYAPYVQVKPGTGRMENKADEQYGIVGMTSNTTSGDPYVKYIASFDPETRVDLCYGVANTDFKSSVDGNNNNVLAGKPYIDVIKPKINDKIYFNFKHALASLNVTIDADIDEVSHGTTDYLATNATKIYVRKVTFEGFADKGSLNLNSEATSENYTPNWFELNSINRRLSSGTVTIYDGRRDGREGQANASVSNETPNNLNSTIIEDEGATTTGVPATGAVNLFDSGTLEAPIFVIPTDENLKVTIVYDVETEDKNLSTYLSDGKTKGSSVENTITKTITYSGGTALKLQAGKAYKVSLHLGMTSVKFDATVTDWPTTTVADNTDLPYNTPGVGAGTTNSFNIDASATSGTFNISGLTVGNKMFLSGESPVVGVSLNGTPYTGTGIDVPSTGDATIKYTVPENTSVSNKAFTVYANERKSDDHSLVTSTVANVTQLCKPFVPSIAWAGGDKQFNITADGTSGIVTEDEWDAAIITVEKSTDSGTTYTKLTKDTDYSIIRPTGRVVVRFGTAPTSCNIKITIKVGDGDAKEYVKPFA